MSEYAENGVAFSGRVSLSQSLTRIGDQLPPPTTQETMLIAPRLIRCLQSTMRTWARRALPGGQCELKATLLLKVSPLESPEERTTQ